MSIIVKREIVDFIVLSIVVIAGAIVLFTTTYIFSEHTKGQVYNCSVAEISPDYPLEVKEQCRKLRAENYEKNLQKPK